ncbi:MAG: nucleobase:cation symporter-2 family protein [PVC group bacterium]
MKTRPFFGVEDPANITTVLLGGFQHVLAMFVGIVTPPLLISCSLGLDPGSTGFLISMALFTSGLTTFIQVKRFGPFGSGLLSVQGTSFTFVSLSIQAGQAGGLPLIFGMTMAAAPVEMILSRFIHFARRLFPPVVTGSVVMLIGTSLIKVGVTDLGGGSGDPGFGSPSNLLLGMFVMAVIIILNRFGRGFLSTVSIALGIVAGYLLAALLGRVDFSPFAEAGWLTVPQPLKFGIDFDPRYLLPWVIGYLITTIESIGDLTASSGVSREPVEGPVFIRRLEGGILSDGMGSLLAGFFNAMPNTTFSQNNGVIGLTGVASRRVGYGVAGILILLGLFPRIAALISVMPKPVLGGATTIMFAMVAVAGLKIIVSGGLGIRNQFILAITLAAGLGIEMVPGAFAKIGGTPVEAGILLGSLSAILRSGLAVGAIVATVLNLLLPRDTGTG